MTSKNSYMYIHLVAKVKGTVDSSLNFKLHDCKREHGNVKPSLARIAICKFSTVRGTVCSSLNFKSHDCKRETDSECPD